MQAVDYTAVVQQALQQPPPTAADISRYTAYAVKRGVSRDKTASAACSMLLMSAFLYNISVWWRLTHMDAAELAGRPMSVLRTSAAAGVCWLLAHVLYEVAFTCWVSRDPALYKRQRAACIMALRTGLLLLITYYIPMTYEHTLALEAHTGREAAATYRMVAGFIAVHVLEILCFRLPTRLAVPYHLARVAFSFLAFPETLRAFARHPEVTDVACSMWDQIGQLYLGAASWVLGAPLTAGEVPAAVAASGGGGLCTVLLMLLFLNLGVGLFVPLYILYVLEAADFHSFMAAGARMSSSGSSNSSSVSGISTSGSAGTRSAGSVTSSAAGDPFSDHHHHDRLAYSSFTRSFTARAAGHAQPDGSRSGSATSGSLWQQTIPEVGSSTGEGGQAAAAVAQHGVLRFNYSCFDVWPVHIGALMHMGILFCGTGMIWAVVNGLWGLWQHNFGTGRCFVTGLEA